MCLKTDIVFYVTDITQWTKAHVTQWLMWTSTKYNLTDVDAGQFLGLDGAKLCQMTYEDMSKLVGAHNAHILCSYLAFLKKGIYIDLL